MALSQHDVARLFAALAALDDLWPTLTTRGQLAALERARERIEGVLMDHGEDVLMATVADLTDELERQRLRMAAVVAAGDALAYFHDVHLERGQLAVDWSVVRAALATWRSLTVCR